MTTRAPAVLINENILSKCQLVPAEAKETEQTYLNNNLNSDTFMREGDDVL